MTNRIAVILLLASALMAADKDKECAAQAEKAVAKYGGELILSHYSPKHGRCYVLEVDVDVHNKAVQLLLSDASVEEKNGSGLAIMRYAFPPNNPEFCSMGGPITDVPNVSRDCAAVRRYIHEHLTN